MRDNESSEKSAVFEVVLDDDVRHGVEDKLDVVGVCGAREVRVDLLRVLALVEVLELLLDVRRRVLKRVATCPTTTSHLLGKSQVPVRYPASEPARELVCELICDLRASCWTA